MSQLQASVQSYLSYLANAKDTNSTFDLEFDAVGGLCGDGGGNQLCISWALRLKEVRIPCR